MLLLCYLAMFSALDPATDVRADDVARAARASYESNRALLSRSGVIRFRLAIGEASDFASARAGRWKSRAEAKGLFAYDGDRGRYEQIFTQEDMKAKRRVINDDSYASPLVSIRALTNGRVTLWDTLTINRPSAGEGVFHTTQIDPGREGFSRWVMMPLDLGSSEASEFSRYLEGAVKGDPAFQVREAEVRNREGKSIAELVLGFTHGSFRYTVDLERGAIPLLTTESYAKGAGPASWGLQEDIRRIDGGAWLPYRRLVFHEDGKALEILVDEVDFKSRPGPEMFRLEFPEPIKMNDASERLQYAPRTVWDLASLPRRGSSEAHPFATPEASPPSKIFMPGERGQGMRLSVIIMLIGASVLVIGVLSVWRHHRASSGC